MDTRLETLMDTGLAPTFIEESKYERIHDEMAQDMDAFCERLFEQADADREPEQEINQPVLYCLSADAIQALRGGPTSPMEVPLGEKTLLTVEEAAAYTGLGVNKIRKISEGDQCPFVLWNGTKRMLKRVELVKYLSKNYSI